MIAGSSYGLGKSKWPVLFVCDVVKCQFPSMLSSFAFTFLFFRPGSIHALFYFYIAESVEVALGFYSQSTGRLRNCFLHRRSVKSAFEAHEACTNPKVKIPPNDARIFVFRLAGSECSTCSITFCSKTHGASFRTQLLLYPLLLLACK